MSGCAPAEDAVAVAVARDEFRGGEPPPCVPAATWPPPVTSLVAMSEKMSNTGMHGADALDAPDLELSDHNGVAFLSGAPRSGELSPYAQKVATETFVWLASMVVFGATSDFARVRGTCNPLCAYGIVTGLFSFILASGLLTGHYMCWVGKMDRHNGWFTNAVEMRLMSALVIWWGAGVGGLSAVYRNSRGPALHTSNVAIFFGWLAFFASIYGAYKAYHNKREDQSYLSLHQQMAAEAANEEDHYANYS